MNHFPMKDCAEMLAKWIAFSQKHLYHCPEREGLICYGAGEHGHWGVHTHQKAFSAFAVMAMEQGIDWEKYRLTREQVLSEALGMLRYNLHTHLTGDFVCTDGEKWGHNWIYTLGLERMMHGVEAIDAHLTEEDRRMLRDVFVSEAEFLLNEYPVRAGLEAKTGDNRPESNIWNGATLYRAALMYPDLPHRDACIRKAQEFFANGISVPSDAHSDEILDGRRVGDMFVGANMFETYACNHHGYMNLGYMAISLSNIAMLHFSLKGMGMKADDIVYHHLAEQWRLIRTLTFDDGRLLRIGGDSRARYCYCQDYTVPVWPLIEDVLGEDCSGLEKRWLEIVKKETDVNGDGSFLSNRFGAFEESSPVYYTRLESDRANVLSMALYWHGKYDLKGEKQPEILSSWQDAYHGASFVTGGNRYASFIWQASEKPQGLLLPRDDSSLAEWRCNLSGRILGVGRENYDEVLCHRERMFPGGFVTSGSTLAYSDRFMAEGQLRETMARRHVAFAALPDESSILCLQYAKALNRTYVSCVKGVLWNVPNDIFNGRQRLFTHANGRDWLQGGDYARTPETIEAGNWVNADGRIGLASLRPLTIVRSGVRQVEILGRENSGTLYAEEICAPYRTRRRWYDRNEELLDAGFAMILGSAADTERLADSLFTLDAEGLFTVGAQGRDGRQYLLIANFEEADHALDTDALCGKQAYDAEGNRLARETVLHTDEAILAVLE